MFDNQFDFNEVMKNIVQVPKKEVEDLIKGISKEEEEEE